MTYTTRRIPGSEKIEIRFPNGAVGHAVKTFRRNAYHGKKTHGWAVFTRTGTEFVGSWENVIAHLSAR